jgi:hypothetical protein
LVEVMALTCRLCNRFYFSAWRLFYASVLLQIHFRTLRNAYSLPTLHRVGSDREEHATINHGKNSGSILSFETLVKSTGNILGVVL